MVGMRQNYEEKLFVLCLWDKMQKIEETHARSLFWQACIKWCYG